MKNAVIIGASTGVGRALAYYLASKKFNLLLVARSERDLFAIRNDIEVNYLSEIRIFSCDFSRENNVSTLIENIKNEKYQNYFLCIGKVIKNDHPGLPTDHLDDLINTNSRAILHFLNNYLPLLNPGVNRNFFIFSSIAVTRPRGNNMVYASSKAFLDFYGRALQHRYNGTKIRIKIIRLGYVDTSMTYGLKLMFPVIKPDLVARKIYKYIHSKDSIIYIPWFWRPVSWIIRVIPWFIYRKLSF